MQAERNIRGMARASADFRRQNAPMPNDPRARVEHCEDCGTPFWRWKGRRLHRCADCAERRQVLNGLAQMHRHGGGYVQTVVSCYDYWRGEMDRLGLLDE